MQGKEYEMKFNFEIAKDLWWIKDKSEKSTIVFGLTYRKFDDDPELTIVNLIFFTMNFTVMLVKKIK